MHYKIRKRIMRSTLLYIVTLLGYMFFLSSCAGLNVKLDTPEKSSVRGNRVMVFPFYDPFYKGHQVQGVGEPFATVFTNKLLAAGNSAELPKSREFSSLNMVDVEKACRYAADNGYAMLITGIITEWIDGATNWSGTVDVAAITVKVYLSNTCELSGSASGRQNGRWFTFVNAPTTRFFEPLSKEIVEVLLK
ncbi:MAG: DUF4823 domain-containing protein [Deltaproteobacteria bacterium]|nr:DUF4823 domain-containing protein [Deltaproteobacteria bacterium]